MPGLVVGVWASAWHSCLCGFFAQMSPAPLHRNIIIGHGKEGVSAYFFSTYTNLLSFFIGLSLSLLHYPPFLPFRP
jgi:hypothetical protein